MKDVQEDSWEIIKDVNINDVRKMGVMTLFHWKRWSNFKSWKMYWRIFGNFWKCTERQLGNEGGWEDRWWRDGGVGCKGGFTGQGGDNGALHERNKWFNSGDFIGG